MIPSIDNIDQYPIKLMSDGGWLDKHGMNSWCKLLYQTSENEWQVIVYENASFIPDESFTCITYSAAIDLYIVYNGIKNND